MKVESEKFDGSCFGYGGVIERERKRTGVCSVLVKDEGTTFY